MLEVRESARDAVDPLRVVHEPHIQRVELPRLGGRVGQDGEPGVAALVHLRGSGPDWRRRAVDPGCGDRPLAGHHHRRRFRPSLVPRSRVARRQRNRPARAHRVRADGIRLPSRWHRRHLLPEVRGESRGSSVRGRVNSYQFNLN